MVRTASTGLFNSSADTPGYQDSESAMLGVGAREGELAHSKTYQDHGSGVLENDELDEAIRQSVRETSRGDPEDDASVERAIKASMAELAKSRAERAAREQTGGHDDDEDLKRALEASAAETQGQGPIQMVDDDELERVLAQSLKEQRRQRGSDSEWDSEADTEEDEDYKRAIQESRNAPIGSDQPPAYEDPGHLAGTTQAEFEAQQAGEKTQQEKTEEEIVMEYAKKQSLLEAQHSSKAKGKAVQTAEDDEDLQQALKMSMQGRGQQGEASGT